MITILMNGAPWISTIYYFYNIEDVLLHFMTICYSIFLINIQRIYKWNLFFVSYYFKT